MHFKRIHIELTNRCNFSCEFCPDSIMTRERGVMDFSLLCETLDEIAQEGFTNQISFHVMGEPLLYPQLDKAVKYAQDKGLKVHLTTNGSLMSEDMLEKLLDANIDHILFSAQTPDEKSFKLRRTKIDFYEYKKHICVLIAKILERKSNTKVSLSFLTTPFKKIILPSREFSIIDNKKDLIGHLGSWLDAILKELPEGDAKTQFSLYMTKLQNRLLSFNMLVWNRFKITNNFILETRVLGDWVHDGLFAQDIHKAAIGSCEGLSKHFGILWNGDMVFCCVDYDGKTRFENVRVTSIARALEQEKVQNAFRGFKKLLVKDQYCQRCIGDVSFERSILRQIGSILYFKIYRPWWEKMSEWEDAPA